MVRIVTVVGARPQFVKAAIVSKAFKTHGGFEETIVHTGQHYDVSMSEIFFDELGIDRPAFNLNVGSGSHGQQTGLMLQKLEEILLAQRPDAVVIYGDTNSTLAGVLAATKIHIPAVHIEAGLRSHNRRMPEEINRLTADCLSSLLFAPTPDAVENLRKEGYAEERICLSGDVMYDAVLAFAEVSRQKSKVLDQFGLASTRYVLVTVHRAENTDDRSRLRSIADGLRAISRELRVVLPLHPRTRAALERDGLLDDLSQRLDCIPPVGYLDMIQLQQHASVIATDSGGVQKEAFFFGTPCVTLRNETEWKETVEAGANQLVNADAKCIVEAIMSSAGKRNDISSVRRYFGNGNASQIIAETLAASKLQL